MQGATEGVRTERSSDRKYTMERAAPEIRAFLDMVIARSGLKLTYKLSETGEEHRQVENTDMLVQFSGQDVEILLANKAEALLALEHLTQECLRMPSDHHERLCFDANDHRLMRIEELRLSALTAAEKVKQTKVPFRFNPMSSRERRIIHLALRDEPAVRSESSGVGPQRGVVIYPAGMPSSAAAPAAPSFRRGRRR